MRAVLQRVSRARVAVGDRQAGAIGPGLLVLLGVEAGDGADDVAYTAGKIRDVRIFEDEQQKMNRSVVDAGGAVLVVSQFTLCGDVRKGRRPSFDAAAPPTSPMPSTKRSPPTSAGRGSRSRPASSAR